VYDGQLAGGLFAEEIDGGTAAILLQLLVDAGGYVDNDRGAAKACIDRASALLERQCSWMRDPDQSAAFGRSVLAPWQVKRVSRHLEENLDGVVRISDLAAMTRLTVSYFSRAFKGSFGMAPQSYIARRRMELAQHLMLTTDESLCQIALACGLSDQAHFSKMFARAFGMPPGVWRRERRGCITRV